MEPIGFTRDGVSWNTLYGPVYDPESPLANEDGFNREYIEAARELRITNMRWPGGNYVSNYHWEDGIGPKEERPVRKELVWGFIDHNQVGTDEWVQLNRAIGSEDVVCINMGTGTLNKARYWVEWNWEVINALRDLADYLSLHRYWEYSESWEEYMGKQAMILEEKISIPAEQSKAVQQIYQMEEPMYLSFDEWAPQGGGLQSTLASAQFLNAFIRHADMVKMANFTLLPSILGRDIETGNTFRTPFF